MHVKKLTVWAALIFGAGLVGGRAANPGNPQNANVITLKAGIIDVSASGIRATGSPVLTSSQGTVSAEQFAVILDSGGRASLATASGGVHFNLVAPTGSYRTVTGSCDRVEMDPTRMVATLSGHLAAAIDGPGVAPLRLSGTTAQVYGALPGRPAHVEVSNARGIIPSRG